MRRILAVLAGVLTASLVAILAIAVASSDPGSDPLSDLAAVATATPEATDAVVEPVVSRDEPFSSTAELVEVLRPSVVHILSETASINVFGQTVPQEGVGTGFIISDDGYIVTNNHVITDSQGQAVNEITVTLADGREFTAQIVGRDPPTDIAVLKIDATRLAALPLGSSSALRVGEDVVAMGNALNLPGGPTVTKGVVSALNRLIQEDTVTIPDAIQTDASINPGNSGGPLVNMQGEVVGITTAVIRGNAEGIGLAISIDSAGPVIDELISGGQVDRGLLGVRIVEITPTLQQQFDLAIDYGVGLEEVTPGSSADEAGLVSGDIIVRLGAVAIRSSGDLFSALTEYRAGETVEIEYYHNGARETATVTLG